MNARFKHIAFFLGVFTLTVLQTGCYYDVESDLYPMNFCDTLSVSYTNTVLPIMQASCSVPGCHAPGGSGTGDFTTYSGLKGQVDNEKLIPAITQSGAAAFMPPSGKLSECEIQKITIWVNAGAPQN
ncbi:MAG: hypothetical protein WAT61_06905 [Flavobacteriales bacterium]